MLDNSTTLILGAGASVPFGLPLAAALHGNLIREIDALERYAEENFSLPHAGSNNATLFSRAPMVTLASYFNSEAGQSRLPHNRPSPNAGEWMIKFRESLKTQTHDSLDRFIHDNAEHRFIGKVLLARHTLLAMYELQGSRYVRRSYSGRHALNNRRNWYHQLINLIRGNVGVDTLSAKKLCIITFNYDHSLEWALDSLFSNTSRHSDVRWREIVTIYHVNGTPVALPGSIYDVCAFLIDCADQIQLVEENAEGDLAKVRQAARKALLRSAQTYVVGFHAGPANMAVIGLPELKSKAAVFCLNYLGHAGVTQRLRNLGIPEANIRCGSRDQALEIDVAIDEGFLEQRPASTPQTARRRSERSGRGD